MRLSCCLISLLLVISSATASFAADKLDMPVPTAKGNSTAGEQGQAAAPSEPAECPIKKTINGLTYCFQNDPALTKPQGGP